MNSYRGIIVVIIIITHATNDVHGSKVFIHIYVCVCVILFVCPHDKTNKTCRRDSPWEVLTHQLY